MNCLLLLLLHTQRGARHPCLHDASANAARARPSIPRDWLAGRAAATSGAQRADAVVVGGDKRRAAVEAQLPALRPAVIAHPAHPHSWTSDRDWNADALIQCATISMLPPALRAPGTRAPRAPHSEFLSKARCKNAWLYQCCGDAPAGPPSRTGRAVCKLENPLAMTSTATGKRF